MGKGAKGSAPDTAEVSCGYGTVTAAEKRRLVVGHFDTIARRYDLADALLSFGLHLLWRRSSIRALSLKPGAAVLDLCGGTGDLAVRAARGVAPAGTVIVCDMSTAMMRVGRRRAIRSGHGDAILWVRGNAEEMSFPDETFDAVMVGFGVRNLAHVETGLAEMHRVLKLGGTLMILEFSVPERQWIKRLYEIYSFKVMPLVGRAVTGATAPYRYLAESIRVFPVPEAFAASLEEAGFARVTFRRLSQGIVTVYLATKDR